MKVRTFFGILPPDLDYCAGELPIEDLPLPGKAVLFVKDDEDAPAGLAVSAGDAVKGGQLLASPKSGAAPVSTVTGKVRDIYRVDWTNGESYTAVAVDTTGEEVWEGAPGEEVALAERESKGVIAQLESLGYDLAALEGAGQVDTVVVSALDCDLLATPNQQLLREQPDLVRSGIELLTRLSGASRAVLAVPEHLAGSAGTLEGVAEVTPIPALHPNGMPEILLRILARKQGLGTYFYTDTEQLCSLVNSASTGKPQVDKVVTVIGKDGAPLKNVRVRVGTPVSELLADAGITLGDGDRLVLGGPLTGRAAFDGDFPVTADTDAVLVQDAAATANILPSQCINCGKCVGLCPVNLPVNLIARYAEFSLFEKCEPLDADCCVDCGLCAYVCTAHRPLVHFMQLAKSEIAKAKKEESKQ